MATTSPAQQIQAILKEPNSVRRSELIFERLLEWSREHGNQFWVLGPVHLLNRGALVRVDGAVWRFLPSDEPMHVAGCVSGSVSIDASNCLRIVRSRFGSVALNYVPIGFLEGMMIQSSSSRANPHA